MVETQKQAILQMQKIDDENKKSISRLQKEGQRLSVQVSSLELTQMSSESMTAEVRRLR
jgi:hypothetical protein